MSNYFYGLIYGRLGFDTGFNIAWIDLNKGKSKESLSINSITSIFSEFFLFLNSRDLATLQCVNREFSNPKHSERSWKIFRNNLIEKNKSPWRTMPGIDKNKSDYILTMMVQDCCWAIGRDIHLKKREIEIMSEPDDGYRRSLRPINCLKTFVNQYSHFLSLYPEFIILINEANLNFNLYPNSTELNIPQGPFSDCNLSLPNFLLQRVRSHIEYPEGPYFPNDSDFLFLCLLILLRSVSAKSLPEQQKNLKKYFKLASKKFPLVYLWSLSLTNREWPPKKIILQSFEGQSNKVVENIFKRYMVRFLFDCEDLQHLKQHYPILKLYIEQFQEEEKTREQEINKILLEGLSNRKKKKFWKIIKNLF